MLGLVINPPPEHDESLLGYLSRLGYCNGLWNGETVKLFKELSDHEVREWLSDDRPLSWHDAVQEIRTSKVNHLKVWSLANLKYCPDCFAEKFYWRDLWDLNLYTVCTVHRKELLYVCPGCQVRSTHRLQLTKCCESCGYSAIMDESLVTNVDKWKLWVSVELEKRLRSGAGNGAVGIDSLTYEQFHFLAFRLGVRALSLECRMNIIFASKSSNNVAPELGQAAARILLAWPGNFYDLLSDLMNVRNPKFSFRLSAAFGLIYNDIYISLADRCYDFVRNEFEQYLSQNWKGPLALRNRRLSECTLLEHRWLPYKKAAQITGLPENFLRRMHVSGALDARAFSYPCGKTVAVIDIEEARRLSFVAHEPLNLRETSRFLCLSRKRIEQLIERGILKFVGGSPRVGEKWLVEYASIVELAPPLFLSVPGDDFITISQIAKHYLPTSGGLAELVMAIQSGEISVFCRNESESLIIGKWLVSPSELKRMKITRLSSTHETSVSVGEAAEMLGVKEEVAYALVRLGLLRSDTIQCSRRSAQVISLAAVQHFKCNYIFSPEVAQTLDASVASALFKLRTDGFLPIAGPALLEAHCRQYVWRRSKSLVSYLASAAKNDVCLDQSLASTG